MQTRIVLFSERNSPFGSNFLHTLERHPDINLIGLVTQPEGRLCPYYLNEHNAVDLAFEARDLDIPVIQPGDVNSVRAELLELNAGYFIVANYQQVLARDIFQLPRLTINFHPTPLPRYAGLYPFFWMNRREERQGGVTAIAVNEKIDGGDIIDQVLFPLSGHESVRELRDIHFDASYRLLQGLLGRLTTLRREDFRKQDWSKRLYFSARQYEQQTSTAQLSHMLPLGTGPGTYVADLHRT